ncbi:hypothetical protein GCM10022394_14270 [Zobellella aerophila]|uniref:Uncharacterized protein n=2 Tax=Zobellella aerophila TaxID=870480 RepID=A0ABP6VH76_9GAMM
MSGEIASALSFWLLIAFANIIATSYLTVSAKFKELFYYDFSLLLTRGGVVLACYMYSITFIDFIYLYSYIGMLFNFLIIYYAINIGKRHERSTDCNDT